MMTMFLRRWEDLARDGIVHAHIPLPVASEKIPFGVIPVPLISIRNGAGPAALLIGGCHGDEYEGQVAIAKLARTLRPDEIRGQIIILPAANYAAAEAGRRFSPIDQGNLNRAFPGQPQGTPTERLAHLIETQLIARMQLVIDLHSGGGAVTYTPSAMASWSPDAARRNQTIELMRIFGLPTGFFIDPEDDSPASLLGACERQGVAAISAELAGGASLSPLALAMAEAGLKRLLHHVGIIAKAPAEPSADVAIYRRLPISETILAPATGLFEPHVEVGAQVRKGESAGAIHAMDEPWREAAEVVFPRDGIVLCRRLPARTKRGDGLFKLGVTPAP